MSQGTHCLPLEVRIDNSDLSHCQIEAHDPQVVAHEGHNRPANISEGIQDVTRSVHDGVKVGRGRAGGGVQTVPQTVHRTAGIRRRETGDGQVVMIRARSPSQVGRVDLRAGLVPIGLLGFRLPIGVRFGLRVVARRGFENLRRGACSNHFPHARPVRAGGFRRAVIVVLLPIARARGRAYETEIVVIILSVAPRPFVRAPFVGVVGSSRQETQGTLIAGSKTTEKPAPDSNSSRLFKFRAIG